ncbi:MAG TPA: ABC transporter ATP-binding protein [Oleiagrimonas sp.]|nr:ABC transporter ATP-binding protein [Oleiagrimonas sp.]
MIEDEYATDERAASEAPTPPRWLQDLGEAAAALRELAQAQWQLVEAELRLARSAARTLMVVSVLVVVFAVALGLTVLGLLGFALSLWLGSWLWALLVLAGLLVLGLGCSVALGRRCLHWLSLPDTRTQWRAFTSQAGASTSAKRQSRPQQSDQEASVDETTSQDI